MEVGNNPFPSDEVTGLAAFENLEPVSSLSVVPEEPDESPASEPPSAHAAAENPAQNPAKERERLDKTLPLDLGAGTLSTPGWRRPSDVESEEDEEEELDPQPEDEITNDALAADGAGDLFDAPSQAASDSIVPAAGAPDGGWDDDAATRVITPLSAQEVAAGSSRGLPMDWDDEEPPTTMRPDAMFESSPIADKSDWDDTEENRTQIYDEAQGEEAEATPARRAVPSAVATLAGGAPSPFPTAPPLDSGFGQPLATSSPQRGDASVPERFVDALKSGDKRSWLVLGGGATGLVLLALIVRAAGAGPAVGTAVFSTTPADAKVSVDDHDVPGTGSPYSLSDLAPGDHRIHVSKPGYTDYKGTFSVGRGETKTLPQIELAAVPREVGFAIRSTPEGAAVWIDGQPANQVTPARLTGITPGIHRLQLKLDGHSEYELQMFVPEGTVLQLPAAELAPTPELKAARGSAKSKKSDEEDELAGAPRRSRKSDLDELSSSRPARRSKTDSDDAEPSSSRASRSYASSARTRSDAEPAHSAPTAAVSGKVGILRLNTRPWSQVIVDGRMVGNTPQPNLQLSAGRHKLQLINQQLGVRKNVTVTIKAGEVTTTVLNLAD